MKKLKSILYILPLYLSFSSPVYAQVFGPINPPPALQNYNSVDGSGLFIFLNIALKLLMVLAGIFSIFQFLLAGYGFMSAGGDVPKMTAAWARIWQSLIGLIVVSGTFVIAGVAGQVIFGDFNALLNPTIYAPF